MNGSGLDRSGIDKFSVLRRASTNVHLLQTLATAYGNVTCDVSLATVGTRVSIANWLQECHGPSLTVIDADNAGLSVRVKIRGLDPWGNRVEWISAAMTGAAAGTVYQCPQPFSYLETIESYEIAGAAAGDFVQVGVVQSAGVTQVNYWIPVDIRRATAPLTLANAFVVTAGVATIATIDAAWNTFTIDSNVTGVSEYTLIFDPKQGEL